MPGSTNFPTTLDSYTLPDASAGDFLNTPGVVHDVVHGNELLAIEAIEATVGVTGSAVPTSQDYRISQLEDLRPLGELPSGYAQIVGNVNGFSTLADIAGLSITVTIAANRRTRIIGDIQALKQTTTGTVNLWLYDGASQIQERGVGIVAAAYGFIRVEITATFGAGVHTFKLAIETGSDTVDVVAQAVQPSFIQAEDVGHV